MSPNNTGIFRRRDVLVGGVSAAAAAILPAGALAQATTLTGIAQHTGPDRQQRLLEGAKREREITIYTSLTTQDVGAIKDAFEAKHGVKVKIWRAGSEQVVQRVVTEARAGRSDADVLLTNGPALEALQR